MVKVDQLFPENITSILHPKALVKSRAVPTYQTTIVLLEACWNLVIENKSRIIYLNSVGNQWAWVADTWLQIPKSWSLIQAAIGHTISNSHTCWGLSLLTEKTCTLIRSSIVKRSYSSQMVWVQCLASELTVILGAH